MRSVTITGPKNDMGIESAFPESKTVSVSENSEADIASADNAAKVAATPSSRRAMNEWFRTSSTKACEAMTSIQLDCRFEGNDFRTEWWLYAEALGFTRVDYYHYRLPPSFDRFCLDDDFTEVGRATTDGMVHTAYSLCEKLNVLSIPQCRSSFDRIGDALQNCSKGMLEKELDCQRIRNTANTGGDLVDQWTAIREELIFRKFHQVITSDIQSRKKSKDKNGIIASRQHSSTTGQKLASSPTRKRKLWSKSDAGAELFFHKGKLKRGKHRFGKVSEGGKAKFMSQQSKTLVVDYPTTTQAYAECARGHLLNEISSVREDCLLDYPFMEDWKFFLSTNHSLLFYGVGSKKRLMESFANGNIDGDVVEINGFDHTLTIDGILQFLVDEWLDGREPTIQKKHLYHVHYEQNERLKRMNTAGRIQPFFPRQGEFYLVQKAAALAKYIAKEVMATSRPITLVIHNLDGVGLSNNFAQEVLSVLVSQSRTDCGLSAIRLVASVDHINAQILTESLSRHHLHWLPIEVHTHRPYVEEVLPDQAVLEKHPEKRQSRSVSRTSEEDHILEFGTTEEDYNLMEQESIFSVLKSLSSSHAESLRQLAWLHLELEQEWVSYTDLLKRCRSERIVQADQQLRLYLGELLDHNILERSHKNESSTMCYRIPYSEDILSLIWNFKRD